VGSFCFGICLHKKNTLPYPSPAVFYAQDMGADNLKLAKECFQEARITDELRPASIKKYASSIKNFLELLGPKNLADLDNGDFNQHILNMKSRGTSNARIANVISAMKWLVTHLRQKGVTLQLPIADSSRKVCLAIIGSDSYQL
jgi:site-specific recombinase XerD